MAVKGKEVGDDSQTAICFLLRLFAECAKAAPCCLGCILNVPFASLLFPIALTAFGMRFKFAAENS